MDKHKDEAEKKRRESVAQAYSLLIRWGRERLARKAKQNKGDK